MNKFNLLRNAVVAIGLADRDDLSPLMYNGKTMIEGTGFLVSSNGYVMTASHVLDSCLHNNQYGVTYSFKATDASGAVLKDVHDQPAQDGTGVQTLTFTKHGQRTS